MKLGLSRLYLQMPSLFAMSTLFEDQCIKPWWFLFFHLDFFIFIKHCVECKNAHPEGVLAVCSKIYGIRNSIEILNNSFRNTINSVLYLYCCIRKCLSKVCPDNLTAVPWILIKKISKAIYVFKRIWYYNILKTPRKKYR